MSGFLGTKGVDTKDTDFVSSYVSYGINKIKITGIEILTYPNKNFRVTFKVETPPISKAGFKPAQEGILGQIGNVGMYVSITNDISFTILNETIGRLGDKLGVRAEVDAITDADPKIYFKKLEKALCNGEYVWAILSGREYAPGKYGLGFPRWSFCKSVKEVDESSIETKLIDGQERIISIACTSGKPLVFNENDEYHLKKYEEPSPTPEASLNALTSDDDGDDLPFESPEEEAPGVASFMKD